MTDPKHPDPQMVVPPTTDQPTPHAVAVTGVSPSLGTGLGPMFVAVMGTGFPTAAGACQIVMKDGGGATVGQSEVGTASPDGTSFSGQVTFNAGTPAGALTPWLVASGVGSAGPIGSFALAVPAHAGGDPYVSGYGNWVGR